MQIVENKEVVLEVNFTEEEKDNLEEALVMITDLITKCKKYGDDINMNNDDDTYYDINDLIRAGATICTFMDDVQHTTFRIG